MATSFDIASPNLAVGDDISNLEQRVAGSIFLEVYLRRRARLETRDPHIMDAPEIEKAPIVRDHLVGQGRGVVLVGPTAIKQRSDWDGGIHFGNAGQSVCTGAIQWQ
jgi:hypothetical protein